MINKVERKGMKSGIVRCRFLVIGIVYPRQPRPTIRGAKGSIWRWKTYDRPSIPDPEW